MKNVRFIAVRTVFKSALASYSYTLWIIGFILLFCAHPLPATTFNWGAFRVETQPSGAIVRALGTFEYLGESPTEPFAFTIDRYVGYNGFMAGRWFNLEISNPGYQTLVTQVFVPFSEKYEDQALKRARVFKFTLQYAQLYYPAVYTPPLCVPYPYPHYYPSPPSNPYHKNSVEISSSPAGASVYIDGVYYGQTPFSITLNWILGVNDAKTVVFEKSGYHSQQKILGPFPKNLHAVLQPRGHRGH